MPYEINLGFIPAGRAASNSEKGEKVLVKMMDYISTDDGESFITALETYPGRIIELLPKENRPLASKLDHMLVLIRKDQSATVYVNELQMVASIRSTRAMEAGEQLMKTDILSIESVEFQDVVIPPECGVIALISIGFRKGLVFDFAPLSSENPLRPFNFSITLAQMYQHLLFQERYRITEDLWEVIFSQGWYPFIGLTPNQIQELVNFSRAKMGFDDFSSRVADSLEVELPKYLVMWKEHKSFTNHYDLLKSAVNQYLAEDYLSCVAIAYPRIEGLLRSYYRSIGKKGNPKSTLLAKTAVEQIPPNNIIFPPRFEHYLKKVYFKNYNPDKEEVNSISRHSVSHGEAPAKYYDQKAAAITMLCIHQLSFTFNYSNALMKEKAT